MNRTKLIFRIFLAFLFCNVAFAKEAGYNISVKVDGLSESNVILGHYFGNSMYPDDTVALNKNGEGVLSGKEKLQEGLYVIYFESGTYFELMMGEDQDFAFETDTNDYVRNLKFEGSKENEIFNNFQLYMLDMHQEAEEIQEQLKSATKEKEKEKLQNQLEDMGKKRIERIDQIKKDNPELFVGVFLKATLDVEVPEELQDDQKARYNYYKKHYFDNFDLSDVRLAYTPLYEDKVIRYLDHIVLQIPDSLIKEIDVIVEDSRSDSALFRYVLITLFNKYLKSNIMGMDAITVHLAKKYYIPESWWSDEKYIKDLEERVAILEPLLIGVTAPDVQLRFVPADHFKQAANDTALKKYPHAGNFFNISEVDADYTVLVFWEATCSHCKKEVPALYKVYEDSLKSKNVQVIAISTLFGEDGKVKWIDFVNKHKLYDWINAWNPYDYKYKEIYDIRSTPQIFVLDKDKKIIGKRLGADNVAGLINAYMKHNIE